MAIRLTCFAVLVCPLIVATTGCSSFSKRMSLAGGDAPRQTVSPQNLRLMQLAQRYEQQGNSEGALRIYRILQQDDSPTPQVDDRIAALQDEGAPDVATPATEKPKPLAPIASASSMTPSVVKQPVVTESKSNKPVDDAAGFESWPQPPVADRALFESVAIPMSEIADASPPTADIDEIPEWAGEPSPNSEIVAAEPAAPFIDEACPVEVAEQCASDAIAEVATTSNPFEEPLEAEHPWARTDPETQPQPGENLAATSPPEASPAEASPPEASPVARAEAAWAGYESTGDADHAVVVLTGLLTEPEPDVVELSTFLLGRMGSEAQAAAGDLTKLRDSAAGSARLHAAEALSRISGNDIESVAILVDGLLKGEPESRWLCALALSNVGPRHQSLAVNALTLALSDSDPDVRSVAALALGGVGPAAEPAVPQLREAAHDSSPEVREAAITALECIRR